jgi:DNA-directed RNA polymerase subunit K/omega
LNDTFLEKARETVSDNWLLINAASRRAAELARGARPLIPLSPGQEIDFLDIALIEIGEGKISVQVKSQGE